MANQINAFELTDEQLDMVAGGKGSSTKLTTNLTQKFNIHANTDNDFTVTNYGKRGGGAGGSAEQNGASFSGIVIVGSADIS
jgi:hypothetical protein